MDGIDAEPKGMAEVLNLTNELADQIMATQIMERPIPEHQLTALINAAQFLQDNDVTWPPLVQEVIQIIAAKMEALELDPSDEAAVSEGLA